MAHHLEVVTNKKTGKREASIAYAKSGGVPWHGLGAAGDDSWSLGRWLSESKSDYLIEKRKNAYQDGDGWIENGTFSLVRDTDQRFYGNASADWRPIQNSDMLSVFADIIDAADATIETVMNLKGGTYFIALAKLKQGGDYEVIKGDVVRSYLMLHNAHKVGCGWGAGQTETRVVCWNTFSAALALGLGGAVGGAHHNKSFSVEQVKEALKIRAAASEKFKEQGAFLASKKASAEDVVTYFKRVFNMGELEPTSGMTAGEKAAAVRNGKQMEALRELLVTQPGANFAKGTFWPLFNTITRHTDHVAGKEADARLSSAWFGQNAARKRKAMDIALEMAG